MSAQQTKSLVHNFPVYAEKCLKIVTKDARLIPFKLNHYQLRLAEVIERQRKENKPVRIIVLKARQVGLSTLSSAYVYHQSVTKLYQNSTLVAHDINSTANLFNMVKRFYDFSPELVKPLSRYSNRRELVFENPDEKLRREEPGIMSKIEVDTAGSSTAGRSSTKNHLHISELAFWPNAKETMSALLQALSSDAGSTCLIESTANGFDGLGKEFYERCKAAQEGRSDFEFFFIPWWTVKEYALSYPIKNLSEKEQRLRQIYNLSNEQLAWRRWKISNDFNGDEMLFCQEYPASPEEAFIHSGRPVFNNEQLYEMIALNEANPYTEEGPVRIFEKPKPNEVYVVGADTAEGLQDGDYSTAFVMDRNFVQVAAIHCHLAPDLFGAELVRLAKMYNNALLCPEINMHGHTVVAAIKNANYTNLYQRELFEKHEIDIGMRLGWHTNIKTKQLMLDELKAAVRDNAITIKDVDLLREMTTLFYEEDGNVTLNGKDRTVAAALAIQAIKQAPAAIKYKAVLMDDEDKPPKFETFLERQRRISKRGSESYFR